MPKPSLPHLRKEKTRHGKTVYYVRRKGSPRVRLPDTYGSEEFLKAYAEALAESAPRRRREAESGSFAWLVSRYRMSARYQQAAPSTRRMRDQVLQNVERKIGNVAYASIKRRHLVQAMEDRAATPHGANNFLKIMSGLFKWAVYHEMISVNPCDGVHKLSAPTDGFHTWTVDQVRQYQAHHPKGTMARLALDLMLYTGLRRSDVIIAGRQHVSDCVLTIRNAKNKAIVSVTIYAALQATLDATPSTGLAFLTTERGTPFSSAASFGNWFRKRCQEAGVPDECRAHGLRKAGATIAAEGGATTRELMAMYGWRTAAMADLYTKAVDRRALAASAGEHIENRMGPHLLDKGAAPTKKPNKIKELKK